VAVAERVPLYRYGLLAWFWRTLIALGLGGGGLCLANGVVAADLGLAATGLPLLLPAVFFGGVVATSIDRLPGDRLAVGTLLGWRRTLPIARLGVPRRHTTAYADSTRIYAPRLWQPVRGRLPVYLDLLATIPDRRAFEAVFGQLPARR
jgi:hypothetical protein